MTRSHTPKPLPDDGLNPDAHEQGITDACLDQLTARNPYHTPIDRDLWEQGYKAEMDGQRERKL